MKKKKNEDVAKQADETLRHISGASDPEEFLTYIFTTLNMKEWLEGAM
jgi:hypothetical protein